MKCKACCSCLAVLLLFLYLHSLKRACLSKREKSGRWIWLGEKAQEQGSCVSEKIQKMWCS